MRSNTLCALITAVLCFGAVASPLARAASSPSAIREVSLSRHGCYGACPSDTISIAATGAVEYVGFAHTAKLGRYRGHTGAKTFTRLLAMTARAKLFTSAPVFGARSEEAPSYDVSARRGDARVRIDVNDPTAAPRPLRDLAGLLSAIRDATSLQSESPVNAVVGSFYAVPSPNQELYIDISMTDDALFKDRGYLINVRRRVAQPCNVGEPKSEEPPLSAVVVNAAGTVTGAGYTIVATAKGIRIAGTRETVDLARVPFNDAPDLELHAAPSAQCPTTIDIQNNSDVSESRPFLSVVSNADLDIATLVPRAHFRCDSAPGLSIGVVKNDYSPADGHPEIDLAPTRDLIANTPCRLIIDAGVSPKGAGAPAAAAESTPFYYVPQR